MDKAIITRGGIAMRNQIIINLRKAKKKGILTTQEFNTLKGQVLSGRERSAAKGFMTIIKRNQQEGIENT